MPIYQQPKIISSFYRASVLIQYIFEDLNFQNPFLVTYICNSLFVVYLPLWQLWRFLGIVRPTDGSRESLSNTSIESDSDMNNSQSKFIAGVEKIDNNILETSYTHYDVFIVALYISPVWFAANCLYNYSLYMTSVSSSTIIR